jgi:hypothetical protein
VLLLRQAARPFAAADQFDQTLRFRMTVISYDGSDDWVEPHIMASRDCLMNETPPLAADGVTLSVATHIAAGARTAR